MNSDLKPASPEDMEVYNSITASYRQPEVNEVAEALRVRGRKHVMHAPLMYSTAHFIEQQDKALKAAIQASLNTEMDFNIYKAGMAKLQEQNAAMRKVLEDCSVALDEHAGQNWRKGLFCQAEDDQKLSNACMEAMK